METLNFLHSIEKQEKGIIFMLFPVLTTPEIDEAIAEYDQKEAEKMAGVATMDSDDEEENADLDDDADGDGLRVCSTFI